MLLTETRDFRQRVFDELNVAVEQVVHDNRDTQTPKNTAHSRNYLKGHPAEWDKVVELQQMMVTCEFYHKLFSVRRSLERKKFLM